ncbi:sushi, von Willebrand factor type A, EGF and pentraxin domain-containing protein 1-like isoform X2 [Biomphalaria glabrata]|uniref:Sushi, von Willebrand factor type A, EGF and pentraxin domain-containing protein 1-like isoform X2 n=1 Tax=Biomphalaria glabrata TaxID=6526 RepID=A0A9W3BHU4_BIOGL|nr:sushi, von Willebrand factor type A, EGF and pentraxin domain-containing protein 1-like isoform X2 [Biomphalaria glabrata]
MTTTAVTLVYILSLQSFGTVRSLNLSTVPELLLQKTPPNLRSTADKEVLLHNSEPQKSDGVAIKCGEGLYLDDHRKCSKCPSGTYNNETGRTICAPCPKNMTTSGTGSTNISECSVDLCHAGQEYVNGSCHYCKVGFYKEAEGNEDCTKCPDNITTLGLASTSRTFCLIPLCRKGYFLNDQQTCSLCPIGTFKNETGSRLCSFCKSGKSTRNIGSIYASQCSVDENCVLVPEPTLMLTTDRSQVSQLYLNLTECRQQCIVDRGCLGVVFEVSGWKPTCLKYRKLHFEADYENPYDSFVKKCSSGKARRFRWSPEVIALSILVLRITIGKCL